MEYLLFFILSPNFALAELRSQSALTTEILGNEWRASLAPGFHFNEKAPNSVDLPGGRSLTPKTLTANQAIFTSPNWTGAKGRLYVCDDAVSFCEIHQIPISKDGYKPSTKKVVKTKATVDSLGFAQGGLADALEKAAKQKKLVMLYFSARWCPGCLRLKREVFPKAVFAAQTKEMIKVRLDTDRFETPPLAERFAIFAIPTIIILNSQGQEVTRILDYQPASSIIEAIREAKKNPVAIAPLIEKAKTSEDQRLLIDLGLRLYWGGRFLEAEQILSRVKAPPPEYLSVRFNAYEYKHGKKELDDNAYAKALLELISKEPHSTRSVYWRAQLVALQGVSNKAEIMAEGIRVANKLLADKAAFTAASVGDNFGDMEGVEPLSLSMTLAELISDGQDSEEVTRAAWSRVADVGNDLKIPTTNVGQSLRHLTGFTQSKRWSEALALVRKIRSADPSNGDLLRRELRILVELGRFKEAVAVGERAKKDSFDRNHLWVVEWLAKAYAGIGQKEKASGLVNEYLQKPELTLKGMSSIKAALEKLKASWETP